MPKKDPVKELSKLLVGWNADASEFDPKEYAMGLEAESEHSPHLPIRHAIASAHLKEDPKYYSKLERMESGT